MRETIRRVPVYQYGCAGGVAGLGLASMLQSTRQLSQNEYTLLTATELCNLVFQPDDHRASQLVGAALFGDGAASVVLGSEDDGLVVRDHRSTLLPNSRHLMGYDTHDDGYHLRLDKELPSALSTQVKPLIDSFLASHRIDRSGVKHWLFHPGGMRVLETLEQVLEVDSSRARWARDVLTTVGNLSSASVLFVMDYFLKSKEYAHNDYVLLVGIGPGLTLELVLFQWQGE